MSNITWRQGRVDTSNGSVSYDMTSITAEKTDIPLGSYQFDLPHASIQFKKVSNGTTTDVGYSNIKRYIFLYDNDDVYLGYQQITNELYSFETSKFANARKFIFECYYNTSYNMYPSQPQVVTETTYYYMELCSFYFNTVRFHEVNDIWISVNAAPVEHEAIELPLPLSYWRIDKSHNNGYPWHERLGDIPYNPPVPIYSIKPQEQIQVYEYTTAQNDLLSRNGNAILFPESCISRHELNGRWDITLTHKIDKLKKWKYLKYENILKVGGQLFRIDTQQTQVDYDKELITAHANHIFYDLNQRIVQRDSSGNERAVFVSDSSSVAAQTFWALLSERPYPLNAIEYWQNVLNSDSRYIPVIWDLEDATPYVFEKHYDSAYWNMEQPSMDYHGKTVVDLLIGSDGFINRWGGEIYRNNFYFSIKPTIEDCQDDSFYLRFPVELKSQVHSIDINKLASIISFIDVNGNYAHGDVQSNIYGLHHHRPVVVQLNVPYSTEVGEIIWNDYKKLPVSAEVELNELKYNARFKDKKIAVPRYHVGDKGYIMIQGKKEHYRIIAVERDEITKDFISITFKKID